LGTIPDETDSANPLEVYLVTPKDDTPIYAPNPENVLEPVEVSAVDRVLFVSTFDVERF